MGIDPSVTATGIEVLDERAERLYGTVVGYQLEETATEREKTERLIWVTSKVIGVAKDLEVTHVGLEGYSFGEVFGGERMGEIGGQLKVQLFLACHLVALPVPPKTARAKVFGKGLGGASKRQVRAMLKMKEMSADQAVMAVSYQGTARSLADALLLKTFAGFGLDIYEVTAEAVGIRLVHQ